MGRNWRSEIGARPRGGHCRNETSSWILGARLSGFMTCVSRLRLMCARRASSVWSATTPSRMSPSKRMAHEPAAQQGMSNDWFRDQHLASLLDRYGQLQH